MSSTNLNVGGYAQIVATTQVATKGSSMIGMFFSAATTTPTVTIYDSAVGTTTTKIVDTFTPVAGTYYPLPFSSANGLYIVLAGVVSATVSFA